MLINGSATLYNRYKTGESAGFARTFLPEVLWEEVTEGGFSGRRYSKKGEEELCKTYVLIPKDGIKEKNYVGQSEWKNLLDAQRAGCFTFQIGDLIVQGNCPYEYGANTPLRDFLSQFDQVASITGVQSVDAPGSLSHWVLKGV